MSDLFRSVRVTPIDKNTDEVRCLTTGATAVIKREGKTARLLKLDLRLDDDDDEEAGD